MGTRHRAIVYARLSRDLAKTGAGVDRQLEDGRRLAHLRGLTIVAELVDNDVSAAGGKHRPGFEDVIAMITAGEVGVVIAWAWDRLSRNRRDTVRLIEAAQEARVTVALVRGSDIDMSTANGRMVADILAGVSRGEIDAKSERQQRAGLQRAESGRPPARRAFGYQQDGTPHPIEAPIVAEMFALMLSGSTMAGITNWLKAKGHTTTRGKPWTDTAVRVALTNPRYIAERYYKGERVAAGNWMPLVTVETFEAVKSILNDPTRKTRRPARRHLGGALFTCWCGAGVTVSYAKNGARTYRCSAKGHMQRIADPVDDLVYQVIAERLRRPDVADLLAVNDSAADATAMRQEAIGLRERLDSLAADYADGLLTGRQVQVATQRISASLADVEGQLAEAGRGSALAAVAAAPDAGDAWLGLPLDRQRAVLAALVTVVILPGRIGRGNFAIDTVAFEWRTA
jgi:site-specific DNA recombinase